MSRDHFLAEEILARKNKVGPRSATMNFVWTDARSIAFAFTIADSMALKRKSLDDVGGMPLKRLHTGTRLVDVISSPASDHV